MSRPDSDATTAAIRRLQSLIEGIGDIPENRRYPPEMSKWERRSRLAIKKLFGDMSDEAIGFANSEAMSQGFPNRLGEARAFLESLIEQIEEYGLPSEKERDRANLDSASSAQLGEDSVTGGRTATILEKMSVGEALKRLSIVAFVIITLAFLGSLAGIFTWGYHSGYSVGQIGRPPAIEVTSPKSTFVVIDSQREVHGGDREAAAIVDSFRLRWEKRDTGSYWPTGLILQTRVPLSRPPVVISADASLVEVGPARELLNNRWVFHVSAPGIHAPHDDLASRETLPTLRFRLDLEY